jgi:DNA polymerase III alpha subunit
MIVNKYGDCILNEREVVESMLVGSITDLSTINISDQHAVDRFNRSVEHNGDEVALLTVYREPTCTVDEYDQIKKQQWLIPQEYEKFDIGQWLLDQCQNDTQRNRVIRELSLFEQKQMMPVLCSLRYLIEVMKEHEIVWGVGRGSSVASYCLFLMGVHKIDSIKYSLDINEFFKGESDDQTNT